jgi:hypothetical protein
MKTPEKRFGQAARANLLRNPPKFASRLSAHAAGLILARLALIHKNSRLTGETKHALFERGAKQMSELL